MDILDTNIDEAVAQFILNKFESYKKALQAKHDADVAKARNRAFAYASKKLIEEKQAWAAKAIQKLEEKNNIIFDLKESIEAQKEVLAEKVDAFLLNSKDDVRGLVEEEIRIDGEELKAQGILEQIRSIVGKSEFRIEQVDESKVKRLEEDVLTLKERVQQKDAANKALKARLHISSLIESVPVADRKFYEERLEGVGTVEEANRLFAKVKDGIRSYRTKQLEEKLHQHGKGRGSSSDKIDESVLVERGELIPTRWKELAGLES